MRRLPEPSLALIVFVVGFSILGAEIAAARLLAPYFGASTVVWANTIGVVLVALSVGYWYGGRLADRNPTREACTRLAFLICQLGGSFSRSVNGRDPGRGGALKSAARRKPRSARRASRCAPARACR